MANININSERFGIGTNMTFSNYIIIILIITNIVLILNLKVISYLSRMVFGVPVLEVLASELLRPTWLMDLFGTAL